MVNIKSNICGDPGPCHQFEAKPSQFFAAFDSLVELTTHSDAYINRSDDFCADNNNNNNNNIDNDRHYPAHVREVISMTVCCSISRLFYDQAAADFEPFSLPEEKIPWYYG